jgi:AraC-like DNA-binding protein
MPAAPLRLESPVTIAAVVSHRERPQLDAAGAGCFAVLHQRSLPDTMRLVRERRIDAVVVSVHQVGAGQVDAVDSLVRTFPDIPTVALVTRPDPVVPELLLRLGATGVRHAVDVTAPAGWGRLRQLLLEPASRPAARILAGVFEVLTELPGDTRLFLEYLVRVAPATPNVRLLARRARITSSTLVSRFIRAGLPSPKSYLAGIRLLYAAQFFEQDGLSIADVAYRLECSSPQSLGRHLRAMLGVTASDFRRRFPFRVAMARFSEALLEPYVTAWSRFHPVGLRRSPTAPKRATRA